MKIFLCLLLVSVCYCLEDSQLSEAYWREPAYHDEPHSNYENVKYPCSLHDVNCIRQYFAHNSRCTPAYGPVPDTIKLERMPITLAAINTSVTMYDVATTGLNDWKIKNFFINQIPETLIFEVEFKTIKFSTYANTMVFHRKGKVPIEITDKTYIVNNDVSLTLAVPYVKNIKMPKSHVFAYVGDEDPVVILGPKFLESRNPTVRASIRGLMGNMPTSVRESFFTVGQLLMSVFLDYNICKF